MAGLSGKLTLTIHKGKDLKDTNLLSKQDPYVEVWVEKEKFKTKVHEKGGTAPVWEQSFIFNLNGKEDVLHLHCWDKETISDDSIGRADIPLKQLKFNKSEWYPVVDKDNFSKVTGSILMTVSFVGTGLPAEPKKAETPPPAKVSIPTTTVQAPVTMQQPQYAQPQQPVYQAPVQVQSFGQPQQQAYRPVQQVQQPMYAPGPVYVQQQPAGYQVQMPGYQVQVGVPQYGAPVQVYAQQPGQQIVYQQQQPGQQIIYAQPGQPTQPVYYQQPR
jgi:hypothetical protein